MMKENLDDDKMIRERVKVEMNIFLGEVLKNVCKQLNEYPYTTIEYEMLKESTYPYTNIERINQEKERILLHLEAIKADCNALAMDVQRTLKLKDVAEEDTFANFSASIEDEEEEALILKERPSEGEEEALYDIVDDEKELTAVAAIFEELLEDLELVTQE